MCNNRPGGEKRSHLNTQPVLIAPADVAGAVLKHLQIDLLWFPGVEDFERWQRSDETQRTPLGQMIEELLSEINIEPQQLPARLDIALAWLGRQESIPTLKTWAVATCARRTFFRSWHRVMWITPSHFLRRLRQLQVQHLIDNGTPLTQLLKQTALSTRQLADLFAKC